MATNGYDLRERPWQPGLDDARFNQQPRNPNFTGGTSPEGDAFRRSQDLRGMSATERPWTGADTKAFGVRPAGVAPPPGERAQGAASRTAGIGNTLRDGYAYAVGDNGRFGPQQPTSTARRLAGRAAVGAGGALAALPEVIDTARVAADKDSTGIDVATQGAEGVGRWGASMAGGAAGAKVGALAGAPLGPIGAGVGGLIGGVAGGAAGYFGADKAIGGLRGALGVTPESPIDRVRAPQGVVDAPGPGASAPAAQPVAAQPVAALTPPPTTQPAADQSGALPPPTNNVVRAGNSYSGTNVAGDISVNGQPPGGGGISAQNMAAADALAGRQAQESALRVAASMPAAVAPTVRHSGNDWQSRNDLRNLEVGASSITNRPEWRSGSTTQAWSMRGAQGQSDPDGKVAAYQAAMQADIAKRSQQPGVDVETNRMNNALRGQVFGDQSRAGASRYAADQSLRGDIFKAQAADRGARYSAMVAAQKQASDDAIRQNDLDAKNADRTRAQHGVYVDGKLDEGASQRKMLAFDKVIPGYSTMGEQARKQHAGTADALSSIYDRTYQGRQLGLGQAVFGNTNPQADSMPNFKGGVLKRQGLAGALPGQAGANGYYVQMPDGREVRLGQDLSENELKLIRRNMQTGAWKD